MDDLFNYYNPATRCVTPMISQTIHDVIVKNAERFNSAIIYDRDYLYNYFGFKVSVLVQVATVVIILFCLLWGVLLQNFGSAVQVVVFWW